MSHCYAHQPLTHPGRSKGRKTHNRQQQQNAAAISSAQQNLELLILEMLMTHSFGRQIALPLLTHVLFGFSACSLSLRASRHQPSSSSSPSHTRFHSHSHIHITKLVLCAWKNFRFRTQIAKSMGNELSFIPYCFGRFIVVVGSSFNFLLIAKAVIGSSCDRAYSMRWHKFAEAFFFCNRVYHILFIVAIWHFIIQLILYHEWCIHAYVHYLVANSGIWCVCDGLWVWWAI